MGADLYERVRCGEAKDPGAAMTKKTGHHRVHFYRLIAPEAETTLGDAAKATVRCSCGHASDHSLAMARKYYLSQESFHRICPAGYEDDSMKFSQGQKRARRGHYEKDMDWLP